MTNVNGWPALEIQANGLKFQAYVLGDGPLVLALHGFPDIPATFSHQLPVLAAAGYRVVAPYMRGYTPSETPVDGSFESAALVQDVLAMLDVLSPEPAILLGHDLGAMAAYGTAIIAPERVSRLVAISLPHGGVFSRSLVTNPVQQRRSWYMYFFQMAFAEMAVSLNDFAFLERLWQEWSPGWKYDSVEMAELKEIFRQPGVVKSALSYYRDTLNPARQDPALAEIRRRQGEAVPVPSLYIHGARDGCIGVELTEGMEKAFNLPLQKHIVAEAGHFVHREHPEDVNRLMLRFLRQPVAEVAASS